MNETPKNVRQVGNIDSSHKIYVEDYVITFTKETGESLMDDNSMECAAAVLLGHKKSSGKEVETYINGMALIDGFHELKEAAFSNDMWSGIYDKIKEFYDDEEIVGWLYIGCSHDVQHSVRLLNIHSSNFSGKNLVFMVYDCEEKEELFFDFINNSFIKRRGFYIYYQKNDTMHNYMIAAGGKKEEREETEDRVVKDIRNILSKRQEKGEKRRIMQTAYAAGMLVAAVVLLAGTSVIYRNNIISDKKDKESVAVSNTLENESTPKDTAAPANTDISANEDIQAPQQETPAPETAVAPEETPIAGIAEAPEETFMPAVTETPESDQTPENTQTSDEGEDTPSADETPVMSNAASQYSFYIVKSGDNLGSISEKIFKSVKYVRKIKELNNLENEDVIYEGQKLWIPEK